MEETYENKNETIGGDNIKKLAMIIFDALGINLVRVYKMKNLNNLYMNRNSQILTCSTYPHTMSSNTMIWSGEYRNLFWLRNKTDKWQDPAAYFNRDAYRKNKSETHENMELIHWNELKDLPWIWNILESNGYKSRAVQLPIVLPPISYNAPEETKDWFPYWEKGLYTNLRDKERITMNALKDMKDDKLGFYCTSFPQPDKLMHSVAEGHCSQQFALDELQYLDKVAKKIDAYCNKNNITYCIFGDHGAPRSQGDTIFGRIPEQKIVVVRHRNHSVIISNYQGPLPEYTDEIHPWMLKFFDIKDIKLKQKEEENIDFTDEDEKIVIERLQKLGYM